MTRQIVTLSMDEETLEKIDNKRGLVPRSAFIKYFILPTLQMAIDNNLSLEEYLEIVTEVLEETKAKLAERRKRAGVTRTNRKVPPK